MTQEIIKQTQSIFEQIKKVDDAGNEFWSARDLAKVLEYLEYRNFKPVIEKAREACSNSGQQASDHFEDILEMVQIGSGAARNLDDVKLSRYACYLIVQNASPEKEVVALGQTYFAVQTRLQEIQQLDVYKQLNTEEEKRLFLRQEICEDRALKKISPILTNRLCRAYRPGRLWRPLVTRHNKKLASAAKNAGVITPIDYAVFQNHGYMGLYGGLDAKGIHQKKALKKNENILDHMGSTELAANLFRTTQTEEKLNREKIKGKERANQTHLEVGKKVRKTIKELGGTMPEDLPVADSIKKLGTPKAQRLKKTPKRQKK